jgi:homoserine trans-succinylase
METTMKYTLITRKGKIMCFYLKDMAELYQQLYGGTIVTGSVIEQKEVA